MIACGALTRHVRDIVARRSWPVTVHPLPPLLHNRPERIAAAVEGLVTEVRPRHPRLAVAYADCGTYGALDELCDRYGLTRLRGAHCYEVFAGRLADGLLAEEPGTYLLTDYLVRTFDRSVVAELGLDRHPELRDAYFGHYRRVVWLAQSPSAELRAAAERAARLLGLPLSVRPVGDAGLERELAFLLTGAPAATRGPDA